MNFILSASRLMKASEVREICKDLRKDKHVLHQQEIQAKSEMYRRLSSENEKAAS
jgi:hypothetical protein